MSRNGPVALLYHASLIVPTLAAGFALEMRLVLGGGRELES